MCWLLLNPLEQHKLVLRLLQNNFIMCFSRLCIHCFVFRGLINFQDHISECVAIFTLSAYDVLFVWGKPCIACFWYIPIQMWHWVLNPNLIIIPLHAPDVCLLIYAARGCQQTNGTKRWLSTTISCLAPHTCSLQSKFPSGDCLFFCIHFI